MDDLLYTLFVVAWIAYGIYKGVKKDKKVRKKTIPLNNEIERPQKEEKTSKVKTAFESIFNEVFDIPNPKNDEIAHPYEEEVQKNLSKNKPDYENYVENEVLDSYNGSDNVYSVFDADSEGSDDREESNKIFDNQTEEEDELEKNTVFDLRQAVIHQVILERPY